MIATKDTLGLDQVWYLNGPVQRGAGKLVVVFGVDDDLHDVVRVALKHLAARPLLVPVPQLDQHVIYTHTGAISVNHSDLG